MKNSLLICDVETGGLSALEHPITQITIEVLNSNTFETLHFFETFVKPYNDLTITPAALTASRVTMQQINSGVDKNILMKGLMTTFKAANKSGNSKTTPYFVGHNFGFDIQFLEYFFAYMNKNLYEYVNRTFFDTMALQKLLEGNTLKASENQKYNLTSCCERMGITLRGAHGSGADVEATKSLFIKQTKLFRNAGNKNAATDADSATKKSPKSSARTGYYFEF